MRARLISSVCATTLLLAACGNAWSGEIARNDARPGVTPTEIRVGSIMSTTSPVGDNFGQSADGTKAYFEMKNSEGGVFGRQLVMAKEYDDFTQASKNVSAARSLVEEDKVFAVLPVATPLFTGGNYLAEKGVPTFGWNINPEWSAGPSMFGNSGSYICFTCAETFSYLPFVAKQIGVRKFALLSYSAVQSKQCLEGQRNALKKYGFEVVFEDSSLGFGFTDTSADVAGIKDAGAEMMATCMDGDGSARISRALRQNGVNIQQYWPIGYNPGLLEQFPNEMEGIYMQSAAVPFEIPGSSPGLQKYLEWMERTGGKIGETSLVGWVNADLLVRGIEAAGEDFTQASVVDAINRMTAYDADRIIPPINWTTAHGEPPPEQGVQVCLSYLQVENSRFVPRLVTEEQPFVCMDPKSPTLPDNPKRLWEIS